LTASRLWTPSDVPTMWADRCTRTCECAMIAAARIIIIVSWLVLYYYDHCCRLHSYSHTIVSPVLETKKSLALLYLSYIFLFGKKYSKLSGQGSVVGITTGCGLDGPGIECRWGRDFPHLSRPVLGPTKPPVQWVPGLSRRYRAVGAWR